MDISDAEIIPLGHVIKTENGGIMMFCPKCGVEALEGAKFCRACGAKLAIVNSQNQPEFEEPPQPTQRKEEPTKFKSWWKRASVFVKVLFVLGCIVAICLIFTFLQTFRDVISGLLVTIFGILLVIGVIHVLRISTEEERSGVRVGILKAVVGLVAVIVVITVVAIKPDLIPNIIQPGYAVRGAYLAQYSEDVTVEEAFQNYFRNPKWSVFENNGYSYVAFTGNCQFMDDEIDVRLTFKVTGEQFRIDSLDINGVEQNDLILYTLLASVYHQYEA